MKWGIIGALDAEVALIREQMTVRREQEIYGSVFYEGTLFGQEAVVVCCSVGKVNAAACAGVVIREFGATAVVNIGIAGAMGSGVRIMDLVASREAAFHDTDPVMEHYYPFAQRFAADEQLLALCERAVAELPELNGRLHTGLVATGDVFVSDRAVKEDICRRLQPLCVEMEGAAVAQIATMNQTPFLIIRTMSDSADDAAQESYDNFLELAAHRSAALILKMLELSA